MQVLDYFERLADRGAFATDHFTVTCEASTGHERERPVRAITLMLCFQPASCDVPLALTLHLTPAGCRVASSALARAGATSA